MGNARTFLIAWLRARSAGGKLLLRLEDLDHPKVKSTAAEEAYRDLSWLGLDWDAGPVSSYPPFKGVAAANTDPYVQSNRMPYYSALMNDLKAKKRVYPCICTRRELESFQSAPNSGEDLLERRYPGTCRGRFIDAASARDVAGRAPGWRFAVEDGATTIFRDGVQGTQESVLSEWSGDFLIARGEKPGYQLAVVADDHDMGVTEVVRGDDLLASTHRQIALYQVFDWLPPAFFHVPLVVGQDGRRLAKRHGDTRIGVLRQSGAGPERVLGWLAWSCGWLDKPREVDLAEIMKLHDFTRMSRERVVLKQDDMVWMGF